MRIAPKRCQVSEWEKERGMRGRAILGENHEKPGFCGGFKWLRKLESGLVWILVRSVALKQKS